MTRTAARWMKFLVAILLGNALYYLASPHLPPAAQHRTYGPDLGTLVDFWFCLFVYGIIELLASFWVRRKSWP